MDNLIIWGGVVKENFVILYVLSKKENKYIWRRIGQWCDFGKYTIIQNFIYQDVSTKSLINTGELNSFLDKNNIKVLPFKKINRTFVFKESHLGKK